MGLKQVDIFEDADARTKKVLDDNAAAYRLADAIHSEFTGQIVRQFGDIQRMWDIPNGDFDAATMSAYQLKLLADQLRAAVVEHYRKHGGAQ